MHEFIPTLTNMKKPSSHYSIFVIFNILVFTASLTNCKKTENPIKFPKGTFPETVVNLANINSTFDDYNLDLYQIAEMTPFLFSSNRKSSGGQFDLEQGLISFVFDQTNGNFTLEADITNNPFFDKLITRAITPANDFGPYTFVQFTRWL